MDLYQSALAQATPAALRAQIVGRYPPMIPIGALADLIDRTVSSLRVSISRPSTAFERALQAARFKIGGRIYFNTELVAQAIAAEMAARQGESGQ